MGMAEKIRKRRIELGLTQEELATKLGVQKSAVAKYESGRVQNIKRAMISKLAQALECDPVWLMDLEQHEENPLLMKLAEDVTQRNRLMAYYEKLSKLTPEHQIAVTTVIDFLASEEAKEKEIKSQSSKEA